jgi:phosphonoacetaldehyde hydrolase
MGLSERSRVKAVVLDWAGTVVDYGCFAPVESFIEVFGLRGVEISSEEARGPMGLEKKAHVQALLEIPAIRARWTEATGAPPRTLDVDSLFEDLEPALIHSAKKYGAIVPGTLELVAALRDRGVAVGSTTGYSPAVMKVVTAEAESQGFQPDALVTPADVPAGRPAPWMCYVNAMRLNAYPLSRMVKIGDTPADIREGLNAGMWTIGVTESGNEMGLTQEEIDSLSPLERLSRMEAAATRLRQAGAHYIVDGVWICLSVLEEIDERIGRGQLPLNGRAA